MGDFDRGRITLGDEDRLPWLEAVEDEDEDGGLGVGKLIALIVLALVALGLIVGGIMWLRQGLQKHGDGSVIAAPDGDYKVPADPEGRGRGMAIEGVGDATYAASQGVAIDSAIDPSRRPEEPVTSGMTSVDATAPKIDARAVAPTTRVGTVALPPSGTPLARPAEIAAASPPKARPIEAPVAKPAEPDRKPETVAATGPSATKQIGAYSSQATAEAGRRDLTSRFPALRSLDLSIQQGTSGGKTVYRIFMKGAKTRVDSVCAALHSAKEGCIPG